MYIFIKTFLIKKNEYITLNCIYVTLYFYKNTFNVSIVRIKVARSTIGSSEVDIRRFLGYVCHIAKVRVRMSFGWVSLFTQNLISLCVCAYRHKKWLPILYIFPFCVYMHTYRTQNFNFYMCAYRTKTYRRIGQNCICRMWKIL